MKRQFQHRFKNPFSFMDIVRSYTESEIMKEYSRMRDVAVKRVKRLTAKGISNKFTQYNRDIPVVAELRQHAKFTKDNVAMIGAKAIVRLAYALGSKQSTAKGLKEIQKASDATMATTLRGTISDYFGGYAQVPQSIREKMVSLSQEGAEAAREVFGIMTRLFSEYHIPSEYVVDAVTEWQASGYTADPEEIALRALERYEEEVILR